MALETLKGLKEINGVEIKRVTWNQPSDNFIEVNDDHNAITFKIQNGPIKEVGKNGCQLDSLLYVALEMLSKLNAKFPCVENERAISSLADSIKHLAERTANRLARNVEGTSQV